MIQVTENNDAPCKDKTDALHRKIHQTMGKYFLFFLFVLQIHTIKGQNRNISNGLIFDGEPFIVVNPSDPQHLVVAWMGFVLQNRVMIKTRVSRDAGRTWSQAQTVQHIEAGYTSADPSLAFDNNGNVFLSYIDYDPYFTSGAVYLRKSADGGLSWGNPVTVIDINADPGQLPVDRPWISVDRSGGEYNGNIYITTVNATGASGPSYHPYFIASSDNGNTFGPWRYADSTGWLAGSLVKKPMPAPVVTSNGTFHCIYPSFVTSQSLLPQFILATSHNAGTTFTYGTVYSSGLAVAVADTSAKKGYLLKANPSNSGHLVFFNLSNENGDSDVFFRESLNAGLTWSEGVRINDDSVGNGRMQDLVWAGFDTDGDLAVTWRDRRNAADTGYIASYEIYCTSRRNESTVFSPNFRISDTSIEFNEILLGNGNDFMSVELTNDTLNAVWGDTRDGKLNIWFQRVTIDGTLVSVQQLTHETLPDIRVFQTGPHTLEVIAERTKRICIFSSSGSLVLDSGAVQGSGTYELNISGLTPGLYVINVETESGSMNFKSILHQHTVK